MPRREFGINAVAADSSPALTEVVCTSGGTVRDIQSQLSQHIDSLDDNQRPSSPGPHMRVVE